MRELSLFSGAGGGLLGTHLLGWRPVGYVEWDDYCQRVLRARIDDGYLPVAPIFTDVREFIQSGAAAEYRGFADVVTGGFPCQPFSTAGKRAGADDPRNMWPATIDIIRVVRPRFAFLENVPGLLSSGYFGTILGDLAASGYDARWRVLSAAELGAPHKRDRLWIVGHAEGTADGDGNRRRSRSWNTAALSGISSGSSDALPDAGGPIEGWGQQPQRGPARRDSKFAGDGAVGTLAHAASEGLPDGWGRQSGQHGAQQEPERLRGEVADADGSGCGEQRRPEPIQAEQCTTERRGWWATEPRLGGMAHGLAAGMDGVAADAEGNLARVARGVPDRVNRLKALGNGQVPAVVAAAWRLLTGGL